MLLLLALGPFLLPEYRNPEPGRFDLLSVAESLAAVLLVVYGLKRIAEQGLAWLPALAIATGLLVGVAFVRRQRTLVDPLLDPRLLANRAFGTALGTNTLVFFVFAGVTLFTAQYLQLVLGLAPFAAGLWTLPSALAFVVGSNLAPKLARRFGPVAVVTAGLVSAAAGSGLLMLVAAESLNVVVAATVVSAAGVGLVGVLILDLILSAAPPERAGAAAGISETSVELGGALGIALLGSIGVAVYRAALAPAMAVELPPGAARAALETLGGAVLVAGQLSEPSGAALLGAARDAFVQGLRVVGIVSAALMAGTGVAVAVLLGSAEARPDIDVNEVARPVEEGGVVG